MTIYALNDPEDAPFAFVVTLYRDESEIWAMQPIMQISCHGYAGALAAYKFGLDTPETAALRGILRRAEVAMKWHSHISGPYVFKTDTCNWHTIRRDFLLMRPEARTKFLENSKI